MDGMATTTTNGFSQLESRNVAPAVERPVFREWAPLNQLIEKIPPKFHQGFMSRDMVLTCVACSGDSLVVGSNSGLVFWFNRNTQQVARKGIPDEKYFVPVTSVAITLSQFGEALAVGNLNGLVAIFSSSVTHSTPVSILNEKHSSPITALSWDDSGLRLLSGDNEGRVWLSQFENNALQPIRQIVLEPSPIIQLKFHPLEKHSVLIASLKRVIMAQVDSTDGADRWVQVGKTDRKQPAPFGADFGYAGNETVIYSTRHNLRLWVSDCQTGSVQKTLFYKDLSAKPRSKLIFLSYRQDYSAGAAAESNFGPVHCLSNGLVLSYNHSNLFILETGQTANGLGQVNVVSSSRFTPKSLRQVAVFHNEIFLLLDNRTVVRVSDRPDRVVVPNVRSLGISGWRAKPTTIQSTISKLANKISDVEIGAMTKPLHQGPYIIESLSNALAPLFELKSSAHPPIGRAAPPKPLNPLCLPCESRSPSPSTSTERSSPTPDSDGHHDQSPYRDDSKERIADLDDSECLESPFSNSSSELGSPPDGPASPADEELVYGSYIGRKRRLKLNRKHSALDESSQTLEFTATRQIPVIPENDGGTWPVKPQVEDGLMEELERKDQLLATLLRLDEINTDPVELTERASQQNSGADPEDDEGAEYVPSPGSERSPSLDEDADELVTDDIYTIYAQTTDTVDKNLPFTCAMALAADRQMSEDPAAETTLPDCPPRASPLSDKVAKWRVSPLDAKHRLTCLSACREYVVAIDNHKSVFYQSTDSSFEARDWLPIEAPASQMVVSSSGRQLWRLYKGTAYQGSTVNPHGPFAERWTAVDSHVASISLVQLDPQNAFDDYVWMFHLNGTLSCRSATSPRKSIPVEVPGVVAQLCCSGSSIFLLLANGNLYSRARVTPESPIGICWQRLHTPDEVTTVALSNHRQLWVLTRARAMFYRHVDQPQWWQVTLPSELQLKSARWLSSLFKRQSSQFELAVTESRVLLALTGTSALLTAQDVTGFSWEKVDWANGVYRNTAETWRMLNANGMGERGIFWLMDSHNRLFYFYQEKLAQVSLPTEETIAHFSVTPHHLWLLTVTGSIFVRAANADNPVGTGWVHLSTLQFQPENALGHLALGSELAWGCDLYGQVYFRSGDNGPPTLLPPAWVVIDEDSIPFKHIAVEPSNLLVWALSREGDVYVRRGVTSEFPIGTSWQLVEGIQAVQLTVSYCTVWALSTGGTIYRRSGVTLQNVCGESWMEIPGHFVSISVTIDDDLWALDAKGALHALHTSSPLKGPAERICDESPCYDEDWVLL